MKTLTKAIVTATIVSLLWGCNSDNASNNNTTPEPTTSSAPTNVTSSPSSQAKNGVTKIDVIAKDMTFVVSSNTAKPGLVEFVTKNDGPSPHELLVVKTDLPVDKLPTKNGNFDENGKGIEEIGEIGAKELKVGTTKTLQVNLKPGKYMLICNLRGHFNAGMVTPFTVQ